MVIDDAAWVEGAVAAYIEGDFNGLAVRPRKGFRIQNLNNLARFAGLQYLQVDGAVLDDTAAFGVESLQELVLLTKCRSPIPRIAATGLTELGIDDRPGKENIAVLPNLRSLHVWSWKDSNLAFLDGARRLMDLRLEGGGEIVSLSGVEGCTLLEEIELLSLRADSLQSLSGLSHLRRIWVIGEPKIVSHTVLDLADVAGLAELEELKLTFAGSVRSVRPLVGMARLRDIRLRGTQIVDGDEAPLATLVAGVTVVRPGE